MTSASASTGARAWWAAPSDELGRTMEVVSKNMEEREDSA
jgi:hypothetical protein